MIGYNTVSCQASEERFDIFSKKFETLTERRVKYDSKKEHFDK